MKLILDTSYLLPLIKIGIENIPHELLLNLLSDSSYECFYSDLSIFEMTAKGLKFSSLEKKISPQDIRIGIDTLQNETRLKKISYTDNPLIIELASDIRTFHNDTIDCLILATAMCCCDCMATMDVMLFRSINKELEIIEKIQDINKNFKFWFNDLSSDFQMLNYIDKQGKEKEKKL